MNDFGAEEPGRARRAELVVVAGLPGAGKTTLAKRIERAGFAVRLCPDEWMVDLGIDLHDGNARDRIEALQWKIGRRLLRCGSDVIIEWGTWGRGEREALRSDARSLGARVSLHYLRAPVRVLYERIHERGLEEPPLKLADVVDFHRRFQAPTDEEIEGYESYEAHGTEEAR